MCPLNTTPPTTATPTTPTAPALLILMILLFLPPNAVVTDDAAAATPTTTTTTTTNSTTSTHPTYTARLGLFSKNAAIIEKVGLQIISRHHTCTLLIVVAAMCQRLLKRGEYSNSNMKSNTNITCSNADSTTTSNMPVMLLIYANAS